MVPSHRSGGELEGGEGAKNEKGDRKREEKEIGRTREECQATYNTAI